MAHIEKVPGGYRVVWRVGGRGSSRKKSPVHPTKRDAVAAQKLIESTESARKPISPGTSISWNEATARYLIFAKPRSTRYAKDITDTCTRMAKVYGWTDPDGVTPDQIKEMLPRNARIILPVVRYAAKCGQRTNPLTLISAPRSTPRKPRCDALTADQVRVLIAMATIWHPSNGALVHMIATYGHRAETLATARVADFDQAAGRITLLVKNGDTIRHPVTTETQGILSKLVADRAPTDALFHGHNDKPWADGHAFAQWWGHSIAEDFPRSAGILDLRRYGISRMLSLGLDARTVADITGHRTVSLLLNTYARSDDARRSAAIAALETANRQTVTPP